MDFDGRKKSIDGVIKLGNCSCGMPLTTIEFLPHIKPTETIYCAYCGKEQQINANQN